LAWNFSSSPTVMGSLGYAFMGVTPLQAFLLIWFYYGWRRVWSRFPSLNRLFPDIAGWWEIEIHWHRAAASGVIKGRAEITQNFLHISMEVHTDDSRSQTLVAQPKKDPESGRPILYYVYRVIPNDKNPEDGGPYEGAAILSVFDVAGSERELSGNYWTTRNTNGHFILRPWPQSKFPN
jgi:hypothetical protein